MRRILELAGNAFASWNSMLGGVVAVAVLVADRAFSKPLSWSTVALVAGAWFIASVVQELVRRRLQGVGMQIEEIEWHEQSILIRATLHNYGNPTSLGNWSLNISGPGQSGIVVHEWGRYSFGRMFDK